MRIKITLPIKDIERKINTQFPHILFEDKEGKSGGVPIRVEKLGDITVSTVSNRLHTTAPIRITADLSSKVGWLGKDISIVSFDITVSFISLVYGTTNWGFKSNTIADFTWDKKPSVNLMFFKVNLDSFIQSLIEEQLEKVTGMIDSFLVEKINTKELIGKTWDIIQKPLPINDEFKVWLSINPSIHLPHLTSPKLKYNEGSMVLQMDTNIVVTIGDAEKKATTPPLPDYLKATYTGDVFVTTVKGNVQFQTIEELLEGKTFTFGDKKQHQIDIQELNLKGLDNNEVCIQAKIKGHAQVAFITKNIHASVRIYGTPYIDKGKHSVQLKDMRYELEEADWLIRFANWVRHDYICNMMQSTINKLIVEKSDEAVRELKEKIKSVKLHEFVTFKANLHGLKPVAFSVQERDVLLTTKIKGQLEVLLHNF